MNVLSLFDGMSCGRIALERANIKIDKYYASEIDKYAIKVAKENYPDTIQVGDVRNVKATDFPDGIDILLGGSPCQGFSFSGKRLNFDDPRSKLFFEYVRLLKDLKPKWFLLENVRMKQECQDVISEHLGVKPIALNSRLVSAQNRYRLYWTNIPFTDELEDRKIMLKDILEDGFITDRDKSHCLDANYFKGGNLKQYFKKRRRQLVFSNKVVMLQKPRGNNKGSIKEREKSPCLSSSSWEQNNFVEDGPSKWRKLTPKECERLQTVPEDYTSSVSNTQRYKMLGNGWTVDVIVHLLKNLTKKG